jgi:L-alanine-DL-glutamate epimerase-like enolase superfamily enzyme
LIEAPWANGYSEPKVVKPYPIIENGFALPLEGPGLGVDFDEAAAAKIPFGQVALQPRLKAKDGSVMDF